eukprot:TRINITY_DN62663_c0_g1_i1.p1 TRINITY_DN62663_c0_g1~~TRINITY_DN62663_c0_g1_i1.p1  ORF type:complete len:127 (-),score=32.17 TRINITY_DN62663_c0_g1_i1:72-395(-)
MDKEEKTQQYRTIKRMQKNYLVRCNESLSHIIPGSGVKPASAIKRIESQIKEHRQRLGQITQEELMSQMDVTSQKKVKNAQELSAKKGEITESIKQLEKQLLEYELL